MLFCSIISVTSTQINAPENHHSTEGEAADDMVNADRIIKISEVTSEVTCDYCEVQDGGTDDHSNQRCAESSGVPHSSEVSEMLKDKMGHVGRGTDQPQVTVKCSHFSFIAYTYTAVRCSSCSHFMISLSGLILHYCPYDKLVLIKI